MWEARRKSVNPERRSSSTEANRTIPIDIIFALFRENDVRYEAQREKDKAEMKRGFKHLDEKDPFAEVDFWLKNGLFVIAQSTIGGDAAGSESADITAPPGEPKAW